MSPLALLLGVAFRQQSVDKSVLQYYQKTFVVRRSNGVLRVPIQPATEKEPPFLTFRRNDTYAVWDERGLSVRNANGSMSTRLPDIATSPKAFSADEIRDTVSKLQSGRRSKGADALSGALRVGNNAYFLVRWDDSAGKPWAEALVSVSLTAKKLNPTFVGRFNDLSTASKPIDDKLQIVDGELAIVSHDATTWGLSTFDPSSKRFAYQPIGYKLISYQPLSATQGLFVETTNYGTTIAGRVDIATGSRKILYEGRLKAEFLDTLEPLVVLAHERNQTKIVNCRSGAVRTLPYELGARRAGSDVLFWTPKDQPTAAWLLSCKDWSPLGRWRSDQGNTDQGD